MYYVLQAEAIEDDEGDELGCAEFDLLDDGVLETPWYDGVVITPAVSPIRLSVNDLDGWGTEFADYCSTPVPLVTERLKAAIEAAGVANVQWFPTAVQGSGRRQPPTYFAMNIVGSVSAVEPARSGVTRILPAPGADVFDDLTLVERRITGLHLFRLAESVSTIVVSDAVKRSVEAASIDTIGFVPVKTV